MSKAKSASPNKRSKLSTNHSAGSKTPIATNNVTKQSCSSMIDDCLNTNSNNEEFCPLCQLPFSILRVQTRAWHVEECMAVDRSKLKECTRGVYCDSTIVGHYLKENHSALAKIRSGLENFCIDEPSEYKITVQATSTVLPLSGISECQPNELQLVSNCPMLNSVSNENYRFETTEEMDQNVSLNGRGCKRCISSGDDQSGISVNVSRVNPKILPQTKITSFFQHTGMKSTKSCDADSKAFNAKDNVMQSLPIQETSIKLNKGDISRFRRPQSQNSPSESNITNEWKGGENFQRRRCPYYKKLLDVPFTVDAFSYGTIPGITAYFLSHFHSDHYQGLNSKFSHAIYCSQVTANLVKLKLRVNESFIHPLPLDIPRIIQSVEVTLIDANHCPGAVMFLFRYQDGRVVLHTGDFRANTEMEQHPALEGVRLDLLYLDTTYCQPRYNFPKQQEVLKFIVDLSRRHLEVKQDTLIVCGSYMIGKEKVFIAIAQSLNKKVWASREKSRVLRCLEDAVLDKLMTQNQHLAEIHVLSMQQISFEFLQDYLHQFHGRYSAILALKPTGWEYARSGKTGSKLESIRPQKRGNITIYGIPYSEHSSYSEMKQFVQFIKPTRVIPTVNVYGAAANQQLEILRSWASNT